MVEILEAQRVASLFKIEEPFTVEPFEGRGNINLDTLLVTAGTPPTAYLLQKVNDRVFPMTDRVMQGMMASIAAQSRAKANRNDFRWEVPTLVETIENQPYLNHATGTWRLMRYIEGTVAYKSLSELSEERRYEAAFEVGRGLAIYTELTSDIEPSQLKSALPGYRNTKVYFDQLDSSLAGHRDVSAGPSLPEDPEIRTACESHFYTPLSEEEWQSRHTDPELQPYIDMALKNRELGMSIFSARLAGEVRTTAIHGDTKIENFLFDARSGEVLALVDLDTIMPYTWLADWGDMVRSLVNVAGEKERDLSQVQVDQSIYDAVSEGFRSVATTFPENERALMPRAVEVIALELGVRFLSDYLRGDTYFRLGPNDPSDLNKARAMVQLTLFDRLRNLQTPNRIQFAVTEPTPRVHS
ncbi:MAG TPA: phosphotransferase [Fimbriimonadaceae bacterium]|nr:phosphotransferase [Fimbriimonadaceae bacterium]